MTKASEFSWPLVAAGIGITLGGSLIDFIQRPEIQQPGSLSRVFQGAIVGAYIGVAIAARSLWRRSSKFAFVSGLALVPIISLVSDAVMRQIGDVEVGGTYYPFLTVHLLFALAAGMFVYLERPRGTIIVIFRSLAAAFGVWGMIGFLMLALTRDPRSLESPEVLWIEAFGTLVFGIGYFLVASCFHRRERPSTPPRALPANPTFESFSDMKASQTMKHTR